MNPRSSQLRAYVLAHDESGPVCSSEGIYVTATACGSPRRKLICVRGCCRDKLPEYSQPSLTGPTGYGYPVLVSLQDSGPLLDA